MVCLRRKYWGDHILKSKYLLIFIVFFSACKPYYNAQKQYNFSETELLEKTCELNFSSQLKVGFSGLISDSVKTYKVSGFIKMESPEHYQIVVYSRTIGIEIGRVEVNNDSILIIDRMGKRYYYGVFQDINFLNSLNIESTDYIKFLFGRGNDCNSLIKDSLYEFTYNYKKPNLNGSIVINKFGFLKVHNIEFQKFKLNIEYSNYFTNTDIPSEVTADVIFKSSYFNIEYSFTEVSKFESKLEQFVIPNGYKKQL